MSLCNICHEEIDSDKDKYTDWAHLSCYDAYELNHTLRRLNNSVFSWDRDVLEEKLALVEKSEEQYKKDLEEYGDIAERIACSVRERIVIPEKNPRFDPECWEKTADIREEFLERLPPTIEEERLRRYSEKVRIDCEMNPEVAGWWKCKTS